jgi:NADH:ubiquinone oxidoreductase subunit H
MYAAILFARGLGAADLDIGLVFVLAVLSLEVVGLFMCGRGSNNKYALLSAMRAVNQIISYEVPFILVVLVPVVLTGSLRLSTIVTPSRAPRLVRLYPVSDSCASCVRGGVARFGEPHPVRHRRGGVGAGGGLPGGYRG